MITREQTDIILRQDTQKAIWENVGSDPADVALKVKENGPLVSTQVKYLRRAKVKLPSYYEARCIIEPLAFEQCSSQRAALAKEYKGRLCVDLTCGLGVDSWAFSKKFDRVISIERDPDLCYLAGKNFELLGVDNIDLRNATAEEFLAGFDGVADMIYVDPARRGEDGSKLYLLEHCSPNVVAMLPELTRKAKLLIIKASPLFDVDEAFRIFGNGITVEAVSVGGECKELIIEVRSDSDGVDSKADGAIKATIAGEGTERFVRRPEGGGFEPPEQVTSAFELGSMRYLLIPDVTLYKTRKVKEYAACNGFYCPSAIGYCFAQHEPECFFGQIHKIKEIVPYQPKKLKTRLRSSGVLRADILKKDFPYGASQVARALGIKEGGADKIAFTTIKNALYALLLI